MKASTAWRTAVIVLLVASIGIGLFVLPTQEYLTRALAWIDSTGVWGPVILGVIYIFACVFFIPGSLITLGAGFIFGVGLGFVTVSIASTLGATAAFLAGRTLARGWIEKRVAFSEKFQAIDRAVERQGFKIVLLTRLSPLFPFNMLNYAFGLTRVRLRSYFFASWIGMLPGTLMFVYVGSAAKSLSDLAAGKTEGGAAQNVLYAVGLLATIVVTVLVTRIARRALSEAVQDPATESSGRGSGTQKRKCREISCDQQSRTNSFDRPSAPAMLPLRSGDGENF